MLSCSATNNQTIEDSGDIKSEIKKVLSDAARSQDEKRHFIRSLKIDDLIEAAHEDEKINALCKNNMLDLYWLFVLQNNKNLTDPARDQQIVGCYSPQVTIHTFDLIKGLHAYDCYRQHRKKQNPEQAERYFQLAITNGNFSALNAKVNYLLAELKQGFNYQTQESLLQTAKRAAELYWTAGHLLLANVYIELANFATQIDSRGKNSIIKCYLLFALQATITAQALEEISGSMINNAFQGKTLLEATFNQYHSWEDFRNKIYAMAGEMITDSDIAKVYQSSSAEENVIKNFYFTTTNNMNIENSGPIRRVY